jgi:hypothetical protein
MNNAIEQGLKDLGDAPGRGRWRRYEENLPLLHGLNQAQRDALALQARPGESWEQLVVRLQNEADAAAWQAIPPCRLCQSRDRYQSHASQTMGICDACNAELLAELGDPETDL